MPAVSSTSLIVVYPFALLIALSTGCATTRLEGTWRDPAFSGPAFKKIMVVGVAKQPDMRRRYEDQFINDLRARGVEGVQSYTLIPQEGQVSRERLEQAVKQSGAQAVLLTRVVGVERESTTYYDPAPAYDGGFYGYYGRSAWHGPVYDSATTYQYKVYTLETKLFDVAGDRMVWTGTTTTEDPISSDAEIKKLSRLLTDALAKAKLI